MRKLPKMALLTAVVGGLSAIGTGVGFADAPALAPQGQAAVQPDAPAQGMVQQNAPQQAVVEQPAPRYAAPQQVAPQYGAPRQTAAQGPQADPQSTQIAPQLEPQLAPQVSPTVTLPQSLPTASPLAPREQDNIFHPEQECSPQTVLQANLPVSLLGGESATKGETCTQINKAFHN